MQNRLMKLVGMLLGACCLVGVVLAREIRTPLPFTTRGYNHYPLPWPVANENCTNVAFWAAGDHRSADRAFADKNGTKTTGLSTLLFGADSFSGTDIFGPSVILPPALIIAEFTPSIAYTENTAVFGFDVYRPVGCCKEWNIGVRGYIPFRAIEIENLDCCSTIQSSLDMVRSLESEVVQNERCASQIVGQSFAYRLDFLAALPLAVNLPGAKMVTFGDGTTLNPTKIDGIDVTQFPPAFINDNPINVFRNDAGVPPPPFALRHRALAANPCPAIPGDTSPAVTDSVSGMPVPPGLPDIGANGMAVASGNRGVFLSGTNYAPLASNVAAQRNLWVVGTASTNNGTTETDPAAATPDPFTLQPAAIRIRDDVEALIAQTNLNPLPPLAALGVSFASQRRYQVGDLLTEFYVNRYWCSWFGEAAFGVRFPTGRTIGSSGVGNLLIAQTPTGNNGHFELRFGGILGWDPVDWFAMRVDGYFNAALRHKENVAAPFAGATIKNIGPAVKANVSWQYVVGDVDFTFMLPCIYPELGFDVGYQIYYKTKDHISLDTTAVSVFSTLVPLDADLLEMHTSQIAHKVKLEFFQTVCGWEIFAGFMHTFAGKNIMRDSDWYLGMKLYF